VFPLEPFDVTQRTIAVQRLSRMTNWMQ